MRSESVVRKGKRHQADVYGDIQGKTGGGVNVYLVHLTGDVYAHDHLSDQCALLGQVDPERRNEFIERMDSLTHERPLSQFIARIEVFNNLGLDVDEAATPACWKDEGHWWASDLSGRYLPLGYVPGTEAPVANEVCYRCGSTRNTSMAGSRYDGLTRVTLPVALADGAASRHHRRPGSEDGAEPRATFVRLSNEMFPDRAIVTMVGEDVSGLTCPKCDLWIGDLGDAEIAHVSTTHRERDGWTCEAEAPSGVDL